MGSEYGNVVLQKAEMNVLQFPIARITAAFIPGIITAYLLKPNAGDILWLLIAILILPILLYYFAGKRFRRRSHFGFTLYALSFIIGIATQIIHTDFYKKDNYINVINPDKEYVLEVILRERLKPTATSERYIGTVKTIAHQYATGRILLNFPKHGDKKLRIGSRLILAGKLIIHKPPLNPDQFDYGKYLKNKSIYAQMYIGESKFQVYAAIKKDFWYYADKLRERMIGNLRKSGFGENELAVLSALILGQQQDISSDVLHDYQYAGAIHVLSVSGLHVGFILLFLNFILKWLPKSKNTSFFKCTIVLLSLWCFTLIAGFSPSVVRSVTMFSFLAVGMHWQRSTNIFHTLLVSLLLILLFQPSFLFDVGFQLSYTALFFILWLQPMLSQLWKPKYRVVQYLWDIITVSFAAQIGAFPLSIYYFHQFPGLFFLTNLVVIPFLGIIMCLGVIVLLSAGIGYIFPLSVKALEWCIYALNKIIAVIASFEDFIIPDIPFNFIMLVTSYFAIVGTIIWFQKPAFSKLAFALIAIFAFQISLAGAKSHSNNNEELVIFHSRKNTIITKRHGPAVTVYSHGSHLNQSVKSYLIANFCKSEQNLPLRNIFIFHEKRILVIDSASVYPAKTQDDVLLLIQSPKINLQRLLKNTDPEIVVADGSNYKSYIAEWKATCKKQKIPFHYTGEKGFYMISANN